MAATEKIVAANNPKGMDRIRRDYVKRLHP